MKSHVTANDPPNNNEEGGDEESNLDARANGNAHGKIHLVADSNHHSRDMLCRVSDDRDQD